MELAVAVPQPPCIQRRSISSLSHEKNRVGSFAADNGMRRSIFSLPTRRFAQLYRCHARRLTTASPFILCRRRLWYTHNLSCTRDTRWSSSSGTLEIAHPVASSALDGAIIATSIKACPGCGGLAKTTEPGEAGHYASKRKAVRDYVQFKTTGSSNSPLQDGIAAAALEQMPEEERNAHELEGATVAARTKTVEPDIPLCDRCHELMHHCKGVPIHHPSIDALHDTIMESPYKHNHIYHVVDAADFPMSVLRNIHKDLDASLQRSKNRRAKHTGYRFGRRMEVSFIITRSDLLAPRKEQVDRLMTYMRVVLRRALGSYAEDARLGNVMLVSAKRGWWTKELKANIWNRGGGGWMVGKANVGKSKLFEVVFPKGRTKDVNFQGLRDTTLSISQPRANDDEVEKWVDAESLNDEVSLLPPARAETPYPQMPTISSLPGTTAAPIRISFGNGKGELIDLPGLARSKIEHHVRPEQRDHLIMKSRVSPQQYSLHGGRSLLLGGDLVRITPVDKNVTVLAYPFVPIPAHMTTTERAIDIQSGAVAEMTGLKSFLNPASRAKIKSAGVFPLKWDVTKQRTGPLTDRSAVGLEIQNLPFKVLSTDLLIEGIGWVELVAQVRRRRSPPSGRNRAYDTWSTEVSGARYGNGGFAAAEESEEFPEVQVFSPEGSFVGSRQSMGAWLHNASEHKPGQKRKPGRPRQAMASVKHQRRAAQWCGEEFMLR